MTYFMMVACLHGALMTPTTSQENKKQEKAAPPFMSHPKWINGLAFSPDGKTLASASTDETVRLWEVATGKELHQWHGHKKPVRAVAVSPDGKTVASGGEDGNVFLWEIGTGKVLNELPVGGRAEGLAFVPGKPGYLATSAAKVTLWEIPAGKKFKRFQKETGGWITSLSFSPDGSRLATGAHDDTLLLWLLIPNPKGVLRPQIQFHFRGHSGGIDHVALSRDLKYLVSGGREALVLWNAEDGIRVKEWKIEVYSNIVICPDDKLMMVSTRNGTTIMDIETRQEVRMLPKGAEGACALALSPNGKVLATGDFRGAIRLWDVESAKEIRPDMKQKK